MRLEVPAALSTLFGSEDRVRTIAILANADRPLTAYRIAKIARIEPPNVYRELSRLSKQGEVKRSADPSEGWVLTDSDLRRMMQRRLRITWSEDFVAGSAGRARRAKKVLRAATLVPPALQDLVPKRLPTAKQISARRQKNAVLIREGGRPSVRAK